MLGALATIISVPILVTYLAFPTQVNNYIKCLHQSQLSGSPTQQSCMTRFYKSIHLGTSASPRTPDLLTRHAPAHRDQPPAGT